MECSRRGAHSLPNIRLLLCGLEKEPPKGHPAPLQNATHQTESL